MFRAGNTCLEREGSKAAMGEGSIDTAPRTCVSAHQGSTFVSKRLHNKIPESGTLHSAIVLQIFKRVANGLPIPSTPMSTVCAILLLCGSDHLRCIVIFV
jgi:hypothetical protein